jgi:Secretion system C-terminal sorting domain
MFSLFKKLKRVNMKKIFIIIGMLCIAFSMQAQTITAAEFFVDSDPGVGNGTAITPAPSGVNPTFVASVPTTSLTNGFHFVGIRTKDNSGKWGLFENRGFYISSATTNVSNIVAAEFFIDTDPGVGNGTPITAPSGANSAFIATVPTTSLANGFHFVAIRTKDADGKWSLFENRGFFISSSTTSVSNIVAAEFFIDTDPGVGNGTPITAPSGANSTFIATVPTTSLANGFHFVAIRTKDADGKWGLFENRGFYISSATTNVSNIVAAEFFIDNDPGVGNATAITPSPSGPTATFVATVPTTSLAAGFHFVAIRTKDANGKWGLFENRGFYISTQTANSAGMTAAEYFIDTDPGIGNGTPFTIPAGQSFNQNFVLPIPAGTPNGNHFIAIRVKNTWGLYAFDTITVSGVVPLTLLSFDAFKNKNKVDLKWTTTNEINTSHFEIERSSNALDFTKIGSINSANSSGINNYSSEDIQPLKGLNFYRLKQVDIDGSFKYSNINKVLFENFGDAITIYPNPAKEYIQFDFASKQKIVLINLFDMQGRLIKTTTLANVLPLKLNVENLSKGNYVVQLSDGEKIAVGSFIKQ